MREWGGGGNGRWVRRGGMGEGGGGGQGEEGVRRWVKEEGKTREDDTDKQQQNEI